MTWKLVYELYIAHLLSCVNFIEINQVVSEYGQLKGFKPIKSKGNNKQCISHWQRLQVQMKKVQVITTINYNVLTTNGYLMGINYENLHYQWMQLFNVKLCKLPNIITPFIRSYYKHYTIYENGRVQ